MLRFCTCAMVRLYTWYVWYGHPSQNGNPYTGYVNPCSWIDDHPQIWIKQIQLLILAHMDQQRVLKLVSFSANINNPSVFAVQQSWLDPRFTLTPGLN